VAVEAAPGLVLGVAEATVTAPWLGLVIDVTTKATSAGAEKRTQPGIAAEGAYKPPQGRAAERARCGTLLRVIYSGATGESKPCDKQDSETC